MPIEPGGVPTRPKSMLPLAIALLTSRPESNLIQLILMLGYFFSNNPNAFAKNSPFGETWYPNLISFGALLDEETGGSPFFAVDVFGLEQPVMTLNIRSSKIINIAFISLFLNTIFFTPLFIINTLC
ncbi:hypothetical protein PthBH41_22800 [Parageobacillus thermoglucosidasius]|nr:hypothetical protein PthBH41_22800 [Parageobacillus thermoglucosidasius]GAJ44455.1 hypothetical protein GT2_17_00880 [Parageobacillus thermoglucosidasius NBRC 107763]